METRHFVKRSRVAASAEELFLWHARPGALERLMPPWERLEVVERSGSGIEPGSRVVLRVGPLRLRWIAAHESLIEGREFVDAQVEGPFPLWRHTHRMEPDGPEASWLEDRIDYALPLGVLGSLVGGPVVRRMLERMFTFRHRVTLGDLACHRLCGGKSMRILVSGASGLVGSALVPFLTTGGHRVTRLVRGRAGDGEVAWDPAADKLDARGLRGVDAVVHLAGESITGRWTAKKKQRIRDSRVRGTRLLAETLSRLESPPSVLVCASAVGFYGDRGSELLHEESAPGSGFLAAVSREWEQAADPARQAGIRVVHLRIGVVLTPRGGALGQMLPAFRMGAGGWMGSGGQYMSWIALDDLLGVILLALTRETLSGPVNAVAPQAVTNREFARTLGRILGRPTLLPVPAFAARLAFGELADEALLASGRVEPRRLLAADYAFRHPDLEAALRHMLGR